ncbi:hypothetical protein PUN28_000656 [Cardiocondyla obscurior]|uniref:Uncharacterized protein n=1 Tax=Cardiocondyla obscurior TaxID=286306 RepID=A0AAW2H0W7_9HYME
MRKCCICVARETIYNKYSQNRPGQRFLIVLSAARYVRQNQTTRVYQRGRAASTVIAHSLTILCSRASSRYARQYSATGGYVKTSVI